MSFYNQKFAHLEIALKNTHQLWVTLNNPEQMNAISIPMIDSLVAVLKHADFDQNIRVIVLTGAGKSFCAGGDIKAMEEKTGMFAGESNELRMRYMHGIQQIPRCIEEISTPIIAMVNGAAIGAGCDLAMMCDLRVGSSASKFAETFTRMGLVPGDGGTFFLQRVVGYSKAMQMFLTAEIFEGKKAFEFGLLNNLFEDSKIIDETLKLADIVSALAPIAQSMTKKAMKISYLHDLHTSLDTLATFQAITQRSADHFEALSAFKQKRTPQFKSE
ncbi:MAG: 3-hxdroxyacyl-CoA dehydrogenase [Alphaproteobacteria bacterium]|nr:MAG: 3-hxdroxyacyl-CoA dehydrogenase [Alphaproteobacteria bacterium]